MAVILSVGKAIPNFEYEQDVIKRFVNEQFMDSFKNIERLLPVFDNGGIKKRQLVKPIEWYKDEHTFEEKNNVYIQSAVELGIKAIMECLTNKNVLIEPIDIEDVDAIFFISSTGIATPSIDARIMNHLNLKKRTKRIPIWGLGCAGGASGLSRAYEYCKAYPDSVVLVLAVELCSLTFQAQDMNKSNIIGTSLFADGVACTCITASEKIVHKKSRMHLFPVIKGTMSSFMRDSEGIMGWDINNEGFHVVFSRDIPTIIKKWLYPQVNIFLQEHKVEMKDIVHFLAHPGGKKVLDAYKEGLGFTDKQIQVSKKVLENHGNMSSATVMYVISEYLEEQIGEVGDKGIIAALGPGFSSEKLLVQWEANSS